MNNAVSALPELLAAQRGGTRAQMRGWEPGEEPPVILEYWRAIMMHKWAILSLGVLCALIAAFVVAQTAPVYRSTALLLIEGTRPRTLANPTEIYTGITPETIYFQTQAEVLRSREIALRVIRENKLVEHPQFDPRQDQPAPWQRWLREKAPSIAALALVEPPATMSEQALENAVLGRFARSLSIEPVRLSQLIRVNFESRDPAVAAHLANAVSRTYAQAELETRAKSTQNVSQTINSRLSELRAKLDASERALQAYRDRENMLDSKSVVLSGTGRQFDDAVQRLGEARARRAEAEAAYNQIRASEASGYSSAPAVLRNSGVQRSKELEAEAERKLAEISKTFGEAHPRYVAALNEVRGARANTQTQIQAVVDSVVKEYNAARATERSIEGSMTQSRGAIQNINRKEIQLNALEREAATNRQIYQEFLTRSRETSVSLETEQARSRIVDSAISSATPVRPNKTNATTIGGVIGLLLGIIGALLLKRLNNTVRTGEDVETKLRQPLLGALPILAGEMKTAAARVALDHPQDTYAESIRTIATGVLLSSLDTLKKVVAITSSVPGEGKSTFAMNFAFSQAAVKKVLLIEADMRRPSFARRWKLNVSEQKGLSELAAGQATFEECLLQVNGTDLHVIMSGIVPPNPLDLLVSQRFAETLAMLREKYDLIVIDCPPVQLVSDAMVVGNLSTGVIYVIKADDTPIPLAKAGVHRIEAAGIPIFGVVLNQHDFVRAERYYGEYSGYGAKYGKYGPYGTYGKQQAVGAHPYAAAARAH